MEMSLEATLVTGQGGQRWPRYHVKTSGITNGNMRLCVAITEAVMANGLLLTAGHNPSAQHLSQQPLQPRLSQYDSLIPNLTEDIAS